MKTLEQSINKFSSDKIYQYNLINKFFLIFLILINFNIANSNEINNINFKEDVEIEKIENQIKSLEQKIKELKTLKKINRKLTI